MPTLNDIQRTEIINSTAKRVYIINNRGLIRNIISIPVITPSSID